MYNQFYPSEVQSQLQNQMQIQAQQWQQRLAQLQQQYPQQFPQQMSQMQASPQQNFIRCMLVSTIDEAKGVIADPLGSLMVFADVGNKRFYTKQMNLDGLSEFKVYKLDDTPIEIAKPPETIDIEQMSQSVNQLKQIVNNLTFELTTLKEEQVAQHELPTDDTASKKGRKPATNASTTIGE